MSVLEERRRKARAMIDEDDNTLAAGTLAKKTKGRRPAAPRARAAKRASEPTTPPHASTSRAAPSSPSLAVKFDGKVYRTLEPGGAYATDGNFFGEPDERVEDLVAERGEARRKQLERELLRGEDDARDGRGRKPASSNYTPTKRRVIERSPSPPRRGSAPFPSHRDSPPTLGLPFSTFPKASSTTSSSSTLCESLQNLVKLHVTLESALVIQLASNGAAVASSSSQTNAEGEALIRIPNLISFPELRTMIESGGRSFTEQQLARLVWVWEGCGLGEGSAPSTPVDELDDDELKVEKSDVGGMGFIITKTRTGSSKGIVTTYGIGISVTLRANPQLPPFELLPPRSPGSSKAQGKRVAPPSPGSVGKGREGMSVVALWSQGQENRRTEFNSRLRDWTDRCSQKGIDFTDIPKANLPPLAAAIPTVPGTNSPKKKAAVPSDVFGPAIPIALPNGGLGMLVPAAPKPKGTGTPKERLKAMEERMRAKESAGLSAYQASISSLTAGGSTLPKSLKPDKNSGSSWRAVEKELYERKSILSRLGNVADGVWMIFEVGRVRSKLLSEVATSIAKSSKVALSLGEAQTSLRLLCELCPDFTYITRVDREDWLQMKGAMGLKDVKARVQRELGR
ncbi:hypothetical protein RQP46_000313 [Phenoliferia psychrophenolica]